MSIGDPPPPGSGTCAPVNTFFTTKTTPVREEWSTGAKRNSRDGKGRFDLIPAYPEKRLAQLYERGGAAHGDRNWEKGQPLSRFLDSAKRHLNDFLDGDRSEDHLIAVVWNCFGFVWTERQIRNSKLPKELDDMGETDR